VGSKGIRRRKPAHHLPKVRLPDENDVIPPNIMWPAPGSGFEADPFSPAGTAQREWWLIGRMGRRDTWPKKLIVLALLAFVAFGLAEGVYYLVQAL
jgi:hypothetical protein